GNSTVRGLVINRFMGAAGDVQERGQGIYVDTLGNNHIEGNFLGIDSAGMTSLPNFDAGVRVGFSFTGNSPSTVIGGTSPQARNVISGNGSDGISIRGTSSGNIVQGNFIGTAIDGITPLGNGRFGVLMTHQTTNNTVGGVVAGAPNVIAFNANDGVA